MGFPIPVYKWNLTVVPLLLGAGFGAPALAGPGDHIQLGALEVVPSVALGLEHRTNVFRRENSARAASAVLLRPGLLAALNNDQVKFNLAGDWQMRKYIQAYARPLDRLNDFNISSGLSLFPERVIGLELTESAALRNNTVDSGDAEDPFATQLRNSFGGRIPVRPGPALTIAPGIAHTYDDFRLPQGARLGNPDREYNSRVTLTPSVSMQWKFFPRTAAVLLVQQDSYSWAENEVERLQQQAGSQIVAIPNSSHVKFRTGLRGQVTERVSANLEIGYGAANYRADGLGGSGDIAAGVSGLEGLIAYLSAKYSFTSSQSLELSYRKDFTDSFFTNYMTYSEVGATHLGQFGERLSTKLKVSNRTEAYNGAVLRTDNFLQVQADGTVRFQDWASTTFGVWYSNRNSTDSFVSWSDVNIHWFATFTY